MLSGSDRCLALVILVLFCWSTLGVLGDVLVAEVADCERFSDADLISLGSSWSLSAFSKIMVGETVLLVLLSDDWLMRPNAVDGPSFPLASDALVFRKFHFLRSTGRITEFYVSDNA